MSRYVCLCVRSSGYDGIYLRCSTLRGLPFAYVQSYGDALDLLVAKHELHGVDEEDGSLAQPVADDATMED